MVWSVGFSGQDSPLLIFLKIHLCTSQTGTKPRSACVSQAVPQCGSEAVGPSDGDAPCTGCSGTWSSSLCSFGCPSFEAEALLSVLREMMCSRERGSHVLRLLGRGRLGRDPLPVRRSAASRTHSPFPSGSVAVVAPAAAGRAAGAGVTFPPQNHIPERWFVPGAAPPRAPQQPRAGRSELGTRASSCPTESAPLGADSQLKPSRRVRGELTCLSAVLFYLELFKSNC